MKSRRRWLWVGAGAAVVVIVAVVSVLMLTSGGNEPEVAPIPGQASDDEERPLTDKIWPAALLLHIGLDAKTQANQPADLGLVDGDMFVVDPIYGRLLEVSADGSTNRVLDTQIDPDLALKGPMAITTHQNQLYIADSDNGQVVIATPSGEVVRKVVLAKGGSSDTKEPRPIGIAVWEDGTFVVSDSNNNRLTKYDADGKVIWSVGTGARGSGEGAFSSPVGVTLDKEGNVYVVDMLNSKVKKFSADGKLLSMIGGAGDNAGAFARAKAVAVDDAGNIFVSDGLQVAIQVFDQAGNFAGFIGRQDPADPNSKSIFSAPHGVKIVDGKLYVVDRYQGLFVFDLTGNPATAVEVPPSTSMTGTQPGQPGTTETTTETTLSET